MDIGDYEMLHGDISNYADGNIVFRVDNFLFRRQPDGTYKFDVKVQKAMQDVFMNSTYTVDVVCMLMSDNAEKFGEELKELLIDYDVPFGRVFIIKHDEEIRFHLIRGAFLYYVDDVEERLMRISDERAIMIPNVYKMLVRRMNRGKRF